MHDTDEKTMRALLARAVGEHEPPLGSLVGGVVADSPASRAGLQAGDLLQIGRYAFRYKERHRS